MDMQLIWVSRKQEYFLFRGLTPFLKIRSDLPVGLICRIPMPGFDLPWRQIGKRRMGWARRETHPRPLQHDGYRFAPPILQAVVVIPREPSNPESCHSWAMP